MEFDVADILNLLKTTGYDRPKTLTNRSIKKVIKTMKFSKENYEKVKDDAVLEVIFRLLFDCKKKKIRYKLKGALPDKKESETSKGGDNYASNLKPSLDMERNEKPSTTVVASIVEFLEQATPEKPIDKEQILEMLIKRFPEKDEASMKNTFGTLVPGRLWETKEIEVVKSPRGYWIHR